MRNVDFDTTKTAAFRIQDYSWQDQAYSQLNRFYSVAQNLDDEFAIAFGMTDNQLGNSKELDTTKFRQAVWNYIHRLHGIFHDDYDYQEVCVGSESYREEHVHTCCVNEIRKVRLLGRQ